MSKPEAGDMGAKDLTLHLTADDRAPSRARRSLDDLERYFEEDLADSVRLLVNELVTNSVKFAGEGSIKVRLSTAGGALRVEVVDDGPGFVPSHEPPALTDTSGRGLYLVESLTDRWGVSMDGRTCVWFEIDAHPAA